MPAQDPGGEQARPTVSRHRDPRRLHDLLHGRRRQSAARDERASPSRRGEHFSAPSAQAWPPSSSPPDLPVGWPTFARSGSNGDRAYGGDRRCCGRPLRYLIERGIQARYKTVFPWATLVANVSACFALGLVTGTATATSPPQVQALIGTGLAGALSTLSTFSYQTLRLAEEGLGTFAIVYVLVSLAAGLVAAAAGVVLGHAAWASPGTRGLAERVPRPVRDPARRPRARERHIGRRPGTRADCRRHLPWPAR